MSKIGILVCGNSGIDYIDHAYDLPVIRSILLAGDKEYSDYVDITAPDFYQLLTDNPSLIASTAQAATGVILEQYEAMVAKGYDELLVITISQKLSGTYEGCMLAAKMLDKVKVTVFDSKSLTYPQAKMALDAASMLQKGKTLDEVLDRLAFIRDNSMIWFTVETLKYLVKNGRLSGASGFVGGLLKIKPLLEVTAEGKVESIEKIRTSSKATTRIIEKFIEETNDFEVEPFIVSTNNPDRVAYVMNELKTLRPEYKTINVYPLTPVVGAHAGPGTIGIGYIKK